MDYKLRDDYISYQKLERRLAENSTRATKADLTKYFDWCYEKKIIPAEATHSDPREFCRRQTELGVKATTIARYQSNIRGFYKWAVMEKRIDVDAGYYLLTPRMPKRLPIYLTLDEQNKLLHSIDDIDNSVIRLKHKTMIYLLLFCGLRANELLKLSFDSVERNNEIPVSLKIDGKGDKERIVPIPDIAKETLYMWMTHRKDMKQRDYARFYSITEKQIESKYLFPGSDGEPNVYDSLRQVVMKACKHAEIKKASPHVLRHTYATRLKDAGVELNVIQRLLGHTNINTTTIYVHLETAELRKSVEDVF